MGLVPRLGGGPLAQLGGKNQKNVHNTGSGEFLWMESPGSITGGSVGHSIPGFRYYRSLYLLVARGRMGGSGPGSRGLWSGYTVGHPLV
jgi:hypothetical protein